MACPTGKTPHPSREAALEHQKNLIWKNNLSGESHRSVGLNVYHCPEAVCGAWHVGHTEGPKIPLVYHYTIGLHLDRIVESGVLKPRNLRRRSEALNEPHPLLWFSWNPHWEHSCLKDPRPHGHRKSPPAGRAVTELFGRGLVRFAAPAFVAKLRWSDYLLRNGTSPLQRDSMAQRGNPVDWLAADHPVPLSDCKAAEVWFRGQWVPGETLGEEYDVYLAGREAVYKAAWGRLYTKMLAADDAESLTLDDEAEAILFEDCMVNVRGEAWRERHLPEIRQFLATWRPSERRHGGRVRR